MTPELTVLTLAALLQVVTFVAYAIPANREVGPGYTMSARDREPSKSLSDRTARLGRAVDNSVVAMALFAPAVLLIEMLGRNNSATLLAAQVFLLARIIYVIVYALGVPTIRTLAWLAGYAATAVLYFHAL